MKPIAAVLTFLFVVAFTSSAQTVQRSFSSNKAYFTFDIAPSFHPKPLSVSNDLGGVEYRAGIGGTGSFGVMIPFRLHQEGKTYHWNSSFGGGATPIWTSIKARGAALGVSGNLDVRDYLMEGEVFVRNMIYTYKRVNETTSWRYGIGLNARIKFMNFSQWEFMFTDNQVVQYELGIEDDDAFDGFGLDVYGKLDAQVSVGRVWLHKKRGFFGVEALLNVGFEDNPQYTYLLQSPADEYRGELVPSATYFGVRMIIGLGSKRINHSSTDIRFPD